MSTASHSSDDKHTLGSLKLKIKFSKSKGFVSDFIEASSPGTASIHDQFNSAASVPQPQPCPADFSCVYSDQTNYSCRDFLDKAEYVEKSLSEINAADCRTANQTNNSGRSSVNGVGSAQPRSRFPVLNSFLTRVPLCVVQKDLRAANNTTELERAARRNVSSEQVKDLGVNYGQVLQDLEFLSSRQDEPDGGCESSSPDKQGKQYLTTCADAAVSQATNMADICTDSRRTRRAEESCSNTGEILEISDEEPMSPFDINCSLGFADEHFTFSGSGENKEKRHDGLELSSKENPLFPWSVITSTAPKPYFPKLPDGHPRKMPTSHSQLQIASKSENMSNVCPASVSTHVNSNAGGDDSVWSAGADRDGGVKRLIVVDCRDHSTTSHNINENNNLPDFSKLVSDSTKFQCPQKPLYRDSQQAMDLSLPAQKTKLLTTLLARKGKAPNALRDTAVSQANVSTCHTSSFSHGSLLAQHGLLTSHGSTAWHGPGATLTSSVSQASAALPSSVSVHASPVSRDAVTSLSWPGTGVMYTSPVSSVSVTTHGIPALRDTVTNHSGTALCDSLTIHTAPASRDAITNHASQALRETVTIHASSVFRDTPTSHKNTALCHTVANHESTSVVRDTVTSHSIPSSSHDTVATHVSPSALRDPVTNNQRRSLLLSPEMTFAVDCAIRDLDSTNQQSALRDETVSNLSGPPGPTSSAVNGSQLAKGVSSDSSSLHLTRTIDELKKRVGDATASQGMPPPAVSLDKTAKNAPSSSATVPLHFTSQIAKSKIISPVKANVSRKYNPPQVWCRCEKPEPETHPHEYNDHDGNKIPTPEVCKLCCRKLSKKWKKMTCKKTPKYKEMWCRCEKPDPHRAEVGAKELCSKCQNTVSKKWKKRMAAKWCKCDFPIPSRPQVKGLRPDWKSEKSSDQQYTCSGCRKLILNDRTDLGMNRNGAEWSNPLTATISSPRNPPAAFSQAMGDHNYSQQPLPAPGTQFLLVPIGVQIRQENATALQHPISRVQPQSHEDTSAKKLVCVFPPQTNSGKNVYQPINNDNFFVFRGNNTKNKAMDQLNTFSTLPPQVTPGTSSTMASTPEPRPELQIDCVTDPPSGGAFFACALPGVPSSVNAEETYSASVINHTDTDASTGHRCTRSCSPCMLTKSGSQTDQPTSQQGIPKETLHPCYVVLDKMDTGLQGTCTSLRSPCPELCRQKSLNILCKKGKLQCKYHSEHQNAQEQDDKCLSSSWNLKKQFFRQHKSLEGYEEYRRRELEKNRMKRIEEQAASGGEQVSVEPASPGFCLLSSLYTGGTMNLHMSGTGAYRKQRNILPKLLNGSGCNYPRESESRKSGLGLVTSRSEQHVSLVQQEATHTSREHEEKVSRKQIRKPEGLISSVLNDKEPKLPVPVKDRNKLVKMSKFNVKYYVFQTRDRAFLVPLIKNNRRTRIKRLDNEDLHYVKVAIGQFLAEKNSCARHLGYPDSVHHKRSGDAVTASSNSMSTTAKQAFVAPTLGAESLSAEELKALISDKDFSRLVPKNSRLSKSKYLEQIGEKVHMYLTGSEETPDWIKDMAKSIVMKHRSRVSSKKRLRPSKDITIEIDYADENEFLDVGEDDSMALQQKAVEGGDSTTIVYEGVDQTDLFHHEFETQEEYALQPTGSFVCEEAYAQEEKKPLLGELMNTTQETYLPGHEGAVAPVVGQRIMIPLPPGTECMQGDGIPSTATSSVSVQQPAVPESEQLAERKPLLGELLASSTLTVPPTSDEHTNDNMKQNTAQVHFEGQPATEQQHVEQPFWPLAVVKQEPEDEGYSHAWSNPEQECKAAVTSDLLAPGTVPLPFISNSTFGRGVVQLEDDTRCITPSQDRGDSIPQHTATPTTVKLEPVENEDVNRVNIPFITSVVSGTAADLWENSVTGNSTTSRDDGESATVVAAESHHESLPQIASVAFGEAVSLEGSTGNHPNESSCGTDSPHPMKTSGNQGQHFVRSGLKANPTADYTDYHVGSYESEHPKESTNNLGDIEVESGESEQPPVPKISVVTFGEAARLWEKEESKPESDVHEKADLVVQPACNPEHQPTVPVISCVAFGDAVAHLEDEVDQDSNHHIAAEDWNQTALCQDEEEDHAGGYDEEDNLEDEDSSFQPEMKPVFGGAADGLVVPVPVVFPSENLSLQTATDAVAELPQLQIGIDLSIVKQEPQDDEETSHFADLSGNETTHCAYPDSSQDKTISGFSTCHESISQHDTTNEYRSTQVISLQFQTMEGTVSHNETFPVSLGIADAPDKHSTNVPTILDTRSLASVLMQENSKPSSALCLRQEKVFNEASSFSTVVYEDSDVYHEQSVDPTITDVRSLVSPSTQEISLSTHVLRIGKRQEKASKETSLPFAHDAVLDQVEDHDADEGILISTQTVPHSNITQPLLTRSKCFSDTKEIPSKYCAKLTEKAADDKGSGSPGECKRDSVNVPDDALPYETMNINQGEKSSGDKTSDVAKNFENMEKIRNQNNECPDTKTDDSEMINCPVTESQGLPTQARKGINIFKSKLKKVSRKRCSSKSRKKTVKIVSNSLTAVNSTSPFRNSTSISTPVAIYTTLQSSVKGTALPSLVPPEPSSSCAINDSEIATKRFTRLAKRSANCLVVPIPLPQAVKPHDSAQAVSGLHESAKESSTCVSTDPGNHNQPESSYAPSAAIMSSVTENFSNSVEADQPSLASPCRTTRRQASIAASSRLLTRTDVSAGSRDSPPEAQKRSCDLGDIKRTGILEDNLQVRRTSVAQPKPTKKQRKPRPRLTLRKKKPVSSCARSSAPQTAAVQNSQTTNVVAAHLKESEDTDSPKKTNLENAEANVCPKDTSTSPSCGLKRKYSESSEETTSRGNSSSSVRRADRSIFSALCSDLNQTSGPSPSTSHVPQSYSVACSQTGKYSKGNGDIDGLFSRFQASLCSSACDSMKSLASEVAQPQKTSPQGETFVKINLKSSGSEFEVTQPSKTSRGDKTVSDTAGLLSRGRRASRRVRKGDAAASATSSSTLEAGPSSPKHSRHQWFLLSGSAAGRSCLRTSQTATQNPEEAHKSLPVLDTPEVSKQNNVCSSSSTNVAGSPTLAVSDLSKPTKNEKATKSGFSLDGLLSRLQHCEPLAKDEGALAHSCTHTDSSKVTRQSDRDEPGLFSRLHSSLASAVGSTAKGAGLGRCENDRTAKDADKQNTGLEASKGPRAERSFFDCLPQGFLGAWK